MGEAVSIEQWQRGYARLLNAVESGSTLTHRRVWRAYAYRLVITAPDRNRRVRAEAVRVYL